MTSKQPKSKSKGPKSVEPREEEWVVADEGEPSVEKRLDGETIDVPDIDVFAPGPDAAAWEPVEPVDASEPEAAPEAPSGKRKRTQRKQRANAAKDEPEAVAPEPAPTPASGRAADAAPVAKRKKSRRGAEAAEPETSVPSEGREERTPVPKRPSRKRVVAEKPVAPQPEPDPSAPQEASWESAASAPSMEQFIAELATLSVPQLVKRHVEALGKTPRIKNRTWLQRKLAWFEQTRRFGGLSIAAKKRLDELMGEIELPVPTRREKGKLPTKSADDLPLGIRLERKWRGRTIVATRVVDGWHCEGATYRTLSGAAKAVSGSHCSGPAFFGIWKPKGGAR